MKIWVLTSEYNEYNQHGEYLKKIWQTKPTMEELKLYIYPYKDTEDVKEELMHILTGGGRRKIGNVWWEDKWFYLKEYDLDQNYDI